MLRSKTNPTNSPPDQDQEEVKSLRRRSRGPPYHAPSPSAAAPPSPSPSSDASLQRDACASRVPGSQQAAKGCVDACQRLLGDAQGLKGVRASAEEVCNL